MFKVVSYWNTTTIEHPDSFDSIEQAEDFILSLPAIRKFREGLYVALSRARILKNNVFVD